MSFAISQVTSSDQGDRMAFTHGEKRGGDGEFIYGRFD